MTEVGTVLVAAIDGPAVGGGAQLAVACDLRVAGPERALRFVGPGTAGGRGVGAPSLVGRGRAMDLCLTMRWVEAEEALRIGPRRPRGRRPAGRGAHLARGIAELEPGAVRRVKSVVATASRHAAALQAEAEGNRTSWSGSMSAPTRRPRVRRAWTRHLGRAVDPSRLLRELTHGTLTEAFHRVAAERDEEPALEVDGVELRYRELDDRAARIGGWLRDHGVRPGDRVLLAGGSSVELIAAYLGILRARATMVPADPASTEDELAQLVRSSGAVAAWAQGQARERLAGIGTLKLIGALEPGSGPDTIAQAVADGTPLEPQGSSGDIAVLAYTSGTTGRPKGVPLTHADLLASLRAAMSAWRWQREDILVHALPLSHQHGLSGAQMTLLSGSRAVLLARFDPEALCDAVERVRATVLFAVPAMYERLLAWDGFDATSLSTLRLWISGSAPLPPTLARRVADALGEPPLERYGSTETGLSVSIPYEGERKIGSVGLPLPGLEVAVLDDQARPVGAGEDGEVVLRGPQVFGGYWKDEEATREAFLPGGWFRTGDLGRVDPADGYLEITGRLKEMIVTGGLNVYPREVELALEEHAAVRQAAVVGVPSEQWGEEVVAFVVAAPDAGDELDEDALMSHVRSRLSAYKCPKRTFVLEALPQGETGKVQRRQLVEMATRQLEEA
jgi:malonyl-CoA/methylmalonyl-CoA synthetase